MSVHNELAKRWNFRKADWNRFHLLTTKTVEDRSHLHKAREAF